MTRTRVRLPGLTARESDLAREIDEIQAIVQDTDWFLKSCIDHKCKEVHESYTNRVMDQNARYREWKRRTR